MPRGARARMRRKRGVPDDVVVESRREVYKLREARQAVANEESLARTKEIARAVVAGDNDAAQETINKLKRGGCKVPTIPQVVDLMDRILVYVHCWDDMIDVISEWDRHWKLGVNPPEDEE